MIQKGICRLRGARDTSEAGYFHVKALNGDECTGLIGPFLSLLLLFRFILDVNIFKKAADVKEQKRSKNREAGPRSQHKDSLG